jgi:hypothetical protein
VRPLYDDGRLDPSAITRDYVLLLDQQGPPLLSIFGGKITTYRKLAEQVMDKLARWLPAHRPWTHAEPLPGGDFGGRDFQSVLGGFRSRYSGLDPHWLARLLCRHGTLGEKILDNAKTEADLGENFGGGLYERELAYLIEYEWARSAEERALAAYQVRPAYERSAALPAARAPGGRAVKPLTAIPAVLVKDIRGVFCDIDDTLTSEGKLTARAYAALERLRSGGRLVIPITGRPAGWCDHIARMWPVDAVVGENGAFYFYCDRAEKTGAAFLFDATARREPRKMAACASASCAKCPAARSPRTSTTARPTRRSTTARTCRACHLPGGPDRRADARGRHDGEDQLHPRQRLVRRLRQAGHDAHLDAGALRRRSRARPGELPVCRRLAQ